MKNTAVTFPCGDIILEGEWLMPEGDGPFPAVVICHPYPPMGGDMKNDVVVSIWNALGARGFAALRFNFRGVGNSSGSFDEGKGEQEDVKAALEFAASYPDTLSDRIGLVGYSFGGMMSLAAALKSDLNRALAIVSSPLQAKEFSRLKDYPVSSLFIIGDKDQMLPQEKFRENGGEALGSDRYHIIPGADHYMGGYESQAAELVADFIAKNL